MNSAPIKQIIEHFRWTGRIDTSVCTIADRLNISHSVRLSKASICHRVYICNPSIKQFKKYHFDVFEVDKDNIDAFDLFMRVCRHEKVNLDYLELWEYSDLHESPLLGKLYDLVTCNGMWLFDSIDNYIARESPEVINVVFNKSCEYGRIKIAKELYYKYPDVRIYDHTITACILNGHNDVTNWLMRIYRA